jgi:hypothetical protein
VIILYIFLVLVWIAFLLCILFGGARLTYDYALDADSQNVPVIRAVGGTVLRALSTLAAVAVVAGLPLTVGWF